MNSNSVLQFAQATLHDLIKVTVSLLKISLKCLRKNITLAYKG